MGVKTVSEARCGSDMCTLLHQNDVVAVVVVEINSIQFNSIQIRTPRLPFCSN